MAGTDTHFDEEEEPLESSSTLKISQDGSQSEVVRPSINTSSANLMDFEEEEEDDETLC